MQNRQPPLDLFVGREAELARLAEVITRVEAGQPWLVAIEGDPGVGKTALARRCLAAAHGLTVMSVDPVVAFVIYRGPAGRLDKTAQRMLLSVENRLRLPLGGLDPDEVASLASALRAGSLDDEAVQWLYRGTGGTRCTCARY